MTSKFLHTVIGNNELLGCSLSLMCAKTTNGLTADVTQKLDVLGQFYASSGCEKAQKKFADYVSTFTKPVEVITTSTEMPVFNQLARNSSKTEVMSFAAPSTKTPGVK